MKQLLTFLFAGLALSISAQTFSGYRTSNYTGVNGVFFNPANVADNRYKWDVNLLAPSFGIYNSSVSLKLSDVLNNFEGDSLLNQFYNTERTDGLLNLDIHGPAFMISMGKKSGLAFTSRVRAFGNITNIDGNLINEIDGSDNSSISLPYTIAQSGKSVINPHGWTELGATYGRVLTNEGSRNFLKAGLTVKYLAGAGNAYVSFTNLNGTLNEDLLADTDEYLQNTTGSVELGAGGIKFDDFTPNDLLAMESSGFGADIGLVYELRKLDSSLNNVSGENNYKLKIGLSVQNMGSITYDRDQARSGGYNIGITGNERFYLNSLEDQDLEGIKNVLDKNPEYFTSIPGSTASSYKVALPGTINLDADYAVSNKFFVNAGIQIPLSSSGGDSWRNYEYFYTAITPRYESRIFDACLPLTFHEMTGFNAGLAFRIGPLFLGSGSAITALVSESKQADFFFGIHFGGLGDKVKKEPKAATTNAAEK